MPIRRINPTSGVWLVYLFVFLFTLSLLLALVRALLPLLVIVGLVGGGWWLWNRYQLQTRQQQHHLNSVFGQLLQEHQGRISVLDFAMRANLKPLHARKYLDEWAKECSAQFDVTEEGDILYYFPPRKSSFPSQNSE
jgi:hypothetical protein